MIVESGNPAHSLANSAACREAFQALELMVVVDVAMTETARLAHYVLPAASQFEKPEATFFNFEFPHNGFQLRRPLLEPLPGTLPEPEIWARLVRALGVVDDADLRPLREAAQRGRQAYAEAFLGAMATNPTVAKIAPLRALRDARADAAGRVGWGGRAVRARPEDRDDLSRRRPACRSRRRQRAVRRDPEQPVRSHVHRAQLRGRLRADQPRRSQDRPGNPRNAGRFKVVDRSTTPADHAGIADRAVGGRAPRLHRQRHLPRPVLAQTRRRRGAARQRRRCPGPWTCRRMPGPHHHRGRQRRGDRRNHRDDACPDMRPCPTVLGSTTSTTTGVPSFPASRRTRSRPRNGATPTRARRGTSTCRRASNSAEQTQKPPFNGVSRRFCLPASGGAGSR